MEENSKQIFEPQSEFLLKLLMRNVHRCYASGYVRADRLFFTFLISIEYIRSKQPDSKNIEEYLDPRLAISPDAFHFLLWGRIQKDVKLPKKEYVQELASLTPPHFLKQEVWDKILLLSHLPDFANL